MSVEKEPCPICEKEFGRGLYAHLRADHGEHELATYIYSITPYRNEAEDGNDGDKEPTTNR